MSNERRGICIPIRTEADLDEILGAVAIGCLDSFLSTLIGDTDESANKTENKADNKSKMSAPINKIPENMKKEYADNKNFNEKDDYSCCDKCCDNCNDMCDNEEEIEVVGVSIENVLYYNPATIVCWSDGTKTKVVCEKGDTYNPVAGLALACIKKMLGNKAFHQLLVDWDPETIGIKEQMSKAAKKAKRDAKKAKHDAKVVEKVLSTQDEPTTNTEIIAEKPVVKKPTAKKATTKKTTAKKTSTKASSASKKTTK